MALNECVAEAVEGGVKTSACEPSVGHETTAETGFLAGLTVTESRRVGTSHCPWVVRAPAGRRVSLTLFNFAGGAATAVQDELSRRSDGGCAVGTALVVFDGNQTTAIPLCSKDAARQRHVYTSHGPLLRLFVQTFTGVAPQMHSKNAVSAFQTSTLGATSFLIKYQGISIHKLTR